VKLKPTPLKWKCDMTGITATPVGYLQTGLLRYCESQNVAGKSQKCKIIACTSACVAFILPREDTEIHADILGVQHNTGPRTKLRAPKERMLTHIITTRSFLISVPFQFVPGSHAVSTAFQHGLRNNVHGTIDGVDQVK
jgi:hypothetical protein